MNKKTQELLAYLGETIYKHDDGPNRSPREQDLFLAIKKAADYIQELDPFVREVDDVFSNLFEVDEEAPRLFEALFSSYKKDGLYGTPE